MVNKQPFYWNTNHNQLRHAQGVPSEIPVIPAEDASANSIMDFNTNTVFHVAQQGGLTEALHIYVTSPTDCTVFFRVVSSSNLAPNGTRTRVVSWPSTVDSMSFKIRANQPSAIPVVQGHVIRNGAAACLMASASGAYAFGFVVTAG